MVTFFVGQPVRVRCPGSLSDGDECRVLALDVVSYEDGIPYVGHRVNIWDEFYNCWCVFEPHELEPILPDGHRAGDYSLSELLDRCRAGEGVPA